MLNLSSLMPEEHKEMSAELHLKHPVTGEELETEDGQPITISLMGMESSVAKKMIKNRGQKMMNNRKGLKMDVDEAMRFNASLLANLTTHWSGICDNDQELQCSKAVAEELYIKHSWIRDQVDEFVSDRENFFKA